MNFNYQNLITGPLGVLHFIINDVGGAYREDLLTFGLTLIKYYILFKFLSFAAKTLFQKIYDGLRAKKWARAAKKKKNESRASFKRIAALIESTKENNPNSIPVEIRKKLPYASITELHTLLITKQVNCVQLLNFFFKRAVDLGLEFNLLSDPLYDFALELAKKNDKILTEKMASKEWTQARDLPPIFGIPVTLKDQYKVKGAPITHGTSHLAFKLEQENGLAVRLIIEAGGVPFAKTNIPQLYLCVDTTNHIFGRAKNPWNPKRSTGGSSGGEGGVAALGISPLGFGSDSGGSCRIPCNFCGVYGMKPTSSRFTYEGVEDPEGNINPFHRALVFGPISNNVDNLERALKTFLNPRLVNGQEFLRGGNQLVWEPERVERILNKKKLRIGLIRGFEEFAVTKPQARAIEEVVSKLEAAGHEVVNFDSTLGLFSDLNKAYLKSGFGSKAKMIEHVMRGEKIITEAALSLWLGETPFSFKWLISKMMLNSGDKRYHDLIQLMKVEETSETLGGIRKLCFEARDKIFSRYRELELDALITPGLPIPAFKHGTN